jgi:hypothetical protein
VQLTIHVQNQSAAGAKLQPETCACLIPRVRRRKVGGDGGLAVDTAHDFLQNFPLGAKYSPTRGCGLRAGRAAKQTYPTRRAVAVR